MRWRLPCWTGASMFGSRMPAANGLFTWLVERAASSSRSGCSVPGRRSRRAETPSRRWEAARSGNPDMVRLLLARGARSLERDGKTSWMPQPQEETSRSCRRSSTQEAVWAATMRIACGLGHLAMAQHLAATGAVPKADDLESAATGGSADLVRWLLESPFERGLGDALRAQSSLDAALIAAVEGRNIDIARLLIQRGADVNAQRPNHRADAARCGAIPLPPGHRGPAGEGRRAGAEPIPVCRSARRCRE